MFGTTSNEQGRHLRWGAGGVSGPKGFKSKNFAQLGEPRMAICINYMDLITEVG